MKACGQLDTQSALPQLPMEMISLAKLIVLKIDYIEYGFKEFSKCRFRSIEYVFPEQARCVAQLKVSREYWARWGLKV